jgi:t-SNARE complex subunit (syntaxin)
MRAFARYRALLKETQEMKKQISDLDEKLTELFQYLLQRIDELHEQKNEPREPVGFKIKGK